MKEQIERMIKKSLIIQREIVAEMKRIRKNKYMGCGFDLQALEELRRDEESRIKELESELFILKIKRPSNAG